jgi:hypothetical protein
VIRIEQVRHQNRAFDLVSVTIRTISSRSSPRQPGADFSSEAAVDRRPSAARDLEALAMRALARAGEDFADGFEFPCFLSSRSLLLEVLNTFPPVLSARSSDMVMTAETHHLRNDSSRTSSQRVKIDLAACLDDVVEIVEIHQRITLHGSPRPVSDREGAA